MLILKKWISGIALASLCVSTAYGATNSDANLVEKASFAKSLDDLQTGSNKIDVMLEGNLTREEAAVLIVEALGYKSLAANYENSNSFKDVTTHKGEINLVKALGLMNGTSQNAFNPKAYVSAESAKTIISRIQAKLETPLKWQHACYAISSSSQMDRITNYDAISFGWASLAYNNGDFSVSTTSGDFKVPSSFEIPVDLAQNNGVETYLIVYYDNKDNAVNKLFTDQAKRNQLIKELVSLCNGVTKEGQTRSFDGLTIDFEQFYSSDLKAPYMTFLKELKAALAAQGKRLNVAVQPTTNFKGYDYKGIGEVADHVILMAHDYGAKTLTANDQAAGTTNTPITPIKAVYGTLEEAVNAISNKDKIALQISYASVQWQVKNNKVTNSSAFTPSYAQIQSRLNTVGTTIHFDETTQDTYATYEADGMKNVIWYEDQRSTQAKIDLAKLLGITSVSYWRLGNMPN